MEFQKMSVKIKYNLCYAINITADDDSFMGFTILKGTHIFKKKKPHKIQMKSLTIILTTTTTTTIYMNKPHQANLTKYA